MSMNTFDVEVYEPITSLVTYRVVIDSDEPMDAWAAVKRDAGWEVARQVKSYGEAELASVVYVPFDKGE